MVQKAENLAGYLFATSASFVVDLLRPFYALRVLEFLNTRIPDGEHLHVNAGLIHNLEPCLYASDIP
jgi:hypothetical protein